MWLRRKSYRKGADDAEHTRTQHCLPLILRLVDRERHFLLWCGCKERGDEAHRRVIGERCFTVDWLKRRCGVEGGEQAGGVGDGVERAEDGWEGRDAHMCGWVCEEVVL